MIDFAKITVKAGDGGRGSGSRVPISRKQYARADGGDGGAGGNVIFEATRDSRGLEPYRFEHFFKAKDGQIGFSNLRRGATAEDLKLSVPLGTVISGRTASREIEGAKSNQVSTNYFEYDLVNEGQQALVARGGRGGRGNAHLRDEYGRRPKGGEAGEAGETWDLTLELKLIADVGLIGLPNAGKSTLIARLTSAKPKIANYPFTTLEPNLGVLDRLSVIGNGSWGKENRYPRPEGRGSLIFAQDSPRQTGLVESDSTLHPRDKPRGFFAQNKTLKPNELSTINDQRIIIADIPGLIEGASEGKGLGHLFLRHIERTKILVHLIDVSKVSKVSNVKEGLFSNSRKAKVSKAEELWNDYQVIRSELKSYSKELAKKKEIIVLNKIDLVGNDVKNEALKLFGVHRKKVLAVSVEKGIGIEELVCEMVRKLK